MNKFHDFMRLKLMGVAEFFIRWANWHHARMPERDLPWKAPEPGFLQRMAAEWDYTRMQAPADKRGLQ